MAFPDPGKRFPHITLRNETGETVPPPPGETLYGFFKTTCPTSALAWPYLDRIRNLAKGGSLSVLAVSQDDPETTARFNDDLGVALATLYDPEPWDASARLGLQTVPAFFLVGAEGLLRDAALGFQRSKMEAFAGRAAQLAGRAALKLFRPEDDVPAMRPG